MEKLLDIFPKTAQGPRKILDPLRQTLEVVAAGAMLYDQIWLGSYMSGGVGFTQYATAAYTDNVLDDFTYFGKEYVEDKYGLIEAPNTMDTVLDAVSKLTSTHWNSSKTTPTTRNHIRWITESILSRCSNRLFHCICY